MQSVDSFAMKKLIYGLLLCAGICFAGDTMDMDAYRDETRRLENEGHYAEALERHLWFHDHALEHQPSLYGVRLSFALSRWKKLGEKYPTALDAMKTVRDDKTKIMLDGKGNHSLFHDICSLNQTLDENEKTIDLFRTLDKDQAGMALICWNVAKDVIIQQGDIDLAMKYMPNPSGEFKRVKESYEQLLSIAEKQEEGKHLKQYAAKRFVEESIQLIDLSLTMSNRTAAIEIQAEALKVLANNTELKNAVPAAE